MDAHGVKLLIGWMSHIGCTVQGVWKLLARHGWSARVPLLKRHRADFTAAELAHLTRVRSKGVYYA